MHKIKIAVSLFIAAAAFGCAAAAAEDDGFTAVMRAMFLSQADAHPRAAAEFAELAEAAEDPDLMREAYHEAIAARDSAAALRYARRWRDLGGGAPSLRAAAHLLLALGRGGEAAPVLFTMKEEGAPNEELFRLLSDGKKNDALPLARKLLDDSADGNLFKARLAARFGEWGTAGIAVARGLSQAGADDRLTELHFVRIRVSARDGAPAVVAPLIDDYVARGCPGAEVVCREAEVIYAFALFSERREWKTAPGENTEDAALAAGRFFERADLPARARPHYERLRGKVFHADLGLARIARDEGRLAEALAVLDSAPVADDREFAMRETTAVEITRELHGAKTALARIVRAREVSPENRELLYEHSLLAEQSGDVPEAVALLEYMTELFPDAADGWNALGYVLADHTLRLDEAEQFIKKALEISPGSANILDSLGWVYYRQGRLDEALLYLQRAAAQSDSAEIAAHLGEVHWRLGEHAPAREAFARGRRNDPENRVLNETLRRLRIAE
ncbi:MAG: tetratricopeptide repeat protein [Gammaproteobacteria bacterium]